MQEVRKSIGGLGNLMFKQAYLYGQMAWKLIPDVYVQSEKYFAHISDNIKAIYSQGIGPRVDYVSLHLRRGDYLKTNFYVDLSETKYYQKAVALFPKDEFLVFCKDTQDKAQDISDREWATEFLDSFIPGRWKFASIENTETEDMNLMASCKSNILANSSFSWWSGYLNPNPDKKVVAPKEWFTDGLQRIDLLPEWKQL